VPQPARPGAHRGRVVGRAAAALTARFTPLELGSDLAGSIRYPAHCCGVYALRTTVGLVPDGDVLAPGLPMFPSVMALGPLARSVEDLELMLAALLPDRDPREVSPPAGGRLRVAVTRGGFGVSLDGPTDAAVRGFAERLAAAGHAVAEVDPPFDFEEGYAVWGLLVGYEFKALLPRPLRARLLLDAFRLWLINYRLGGSPLTEHVRRGLHASEAEYREGLAKRSELTRSAAHLLAQHDVWVLPVSPGVAIRRGRAGRPLRAAGGPVPYTHYLGRLLCPTAAIGTPALSLPVGLGAGRLPVGVQVHALPYADRWLVGTAGPALAAAAIATPRPPWDA
jgi:amidase